jgi:UDP-N-acetylmuramate dehydrogenase
MESLAGVPGTFGGAVRGNAGAFGTETGKFVFSVTVFDTDSLEIKEIKKKDCDFSYRSSYFKKNKNLIVLAAKLELALTSKEECQLKVKETITGRTHKGLQGVRSAGSFFMNPKVDNNPTLLEEFAKDKGMAARNNVLPAGWVIDRAGLRGKKIGGAAVSEEHANYLINLGDAKAEDVIMLVSYVKQQVRDQLGIQLQEEVNYVGF